jgi:hypothetical protein
MIRRHQMSAQIEEICDGSVHADESLRLACRDVSWIDSGMSSRRATV